MTEEAVMKRLTAEELAEYERQINNGEFCITQQLALLATASRLVEVEKRFPASDALAEAAALELFERQRPETAVRSRNEAQRGETSPRFAAEDVEEAFVDGYLAALKALGWTSPTQKPNDGGRE